MDNAEHRLAILDQTDIHGEGAVAVGAEKLARAVNRVDEKEAWRRRHGVAGGVFL